MSAEEDKKVSSAGLGTRRAGLWLTQNQLKIQVEHINLKVTGPDGGEVGKSRSSSDTVEEANPMRLETAFKIKKTTNLSKLMDAYATKTGQVNSQHSLTRTAVVQLFVLPLCLDPWTGVDTGLTRPFMVS